MAVFAFSYHPKVLRSTATLVHGWESARPSFFEACGATDRAPLTLNLQLGDVRDAMAVAKTYHGWLPPGYVSPSGGRSFCQVERVRQHVERRVLNSFLGAGGQQPIRHLARRGFTGAGADGTTSTRGAVWQYDARDGGGAARCVGCARPVRVVVLVG